LFAYPVGVAYGILLDGYDPGWTHRIKPGTDLGKLVERFAGVQPLKDLEAAAVSYGGPEIRDRETSREVEQRAPRYVVTDLSADAASRQIAVLPQLARQQLLVESGPRGATNFADERLAWEGSRKQIKVSGR
jgi:hypothetical protein